MTRYSQKDAVTCARRLSKELKVKQFGNCSPKKIGEGSKIGCWTLSTNIGGHVIHEIKNKGGGVSFPLWSRRLKSREFCEVVEFVETALDYMKRKKR